MSARSSAPPLLPYAARAGDAGLRVEVQRLDADHVVTRMGRHAHLFYELAMFDRGGGDHEFAGRRERVRAGDLYAIAPGEAHDCTELGRAEGWLILFCGEVAQAGGADAPWRAFLRDGRGGSGARLVLGDATHFARTFKRAHGCPPGAWRRSQDPPGAAKDPL